jgi:hypothetical protein
MTIEIGSKYLLDGKVIVIVVKPLNRSKTVFSIEIPGVRVDSVEKHRLREINVPKAIPENQT